MENSDNPPFDPVELELQTQSKIAYKYDQQRKNNEKELKVAEHKLTLQKAKDGFHFLPENELQLKQIQDEQKDPPLVLNHELFDDPSKNMPGLETSTLSIGEKKQLLGYYQKAIAVFGNTHAPSYFLTGEAILQEEIIAAENSGNKTESKTKIRNKAQAIKIAEPTNPLSDPIDLELNTQNQLAKGNETQRTINKEKIEKNVTSTNCRRG